MKAIAAIPARLGSTRLANKPLLDDTGLPLVVHTARNAQRANLLAAVVVVTGSPKIASVCGQHGVQVVCFDCDAWCGTVRVAEAVRRGLIDADVVLNVQCDEPCVQASSLDELVGLIKMEDDRTVCTIVAPLTAASQFADENLVKADVDYAGQCHWFCRNGWFTRAFAHVGVYGFRRQTLLAAAELPQSDASRKWSLEQLSWIELDRPHTYHAQLQPQRLLKMKAVYAQSLPLSVNSPSDYAQFIRQYGPEVVMVP